MNKNKVVMCVVGVLILLILAFYIKNWDAFSQPRVKSEGTARYISKQDAVDKAIRELKELFPGHSLSEWDETADILTLSIWIDGSQLTAAKAKDGSQAARAAWKSLTDDLTAAGAAWQKSFDEAGHKTMVVMRLLNPDNHELALASVRRGELTYDCVSSLLK